MSDTPSETGKPSMLQMMASVLAAFAGVQSDANLDRDDNHIDKHGFKPYIIIGIALTLALAIYLIVQLVLYLAN